MLRSPAWASWLDAKQRCLWIHGIPGAGKTVLMSYLIEQIKQHCDQSQKGKSAYAYYYSYFGHNQDEAVPFLRWLINQLCRQADLVSGNVYKMYKHGGEPSLVELLNALEDILDEFEITYVVADAIDESNPREDLLKVFRDLVTDSRFKKLQLLASSREYIDIERVMEEFSVSVSMANPFVEEDIRLHVRSTLQSNSKFRRWPQEPLDEVEDAVSTGARGMYVAVHTSLQWCSYH
jgi:Cdc6-like AAA superfamily ATPase